MTNVLVFALWNWRLDAGGPFYREALTCRKRGASYFPQMSMSADAPNYQPHWAPHFIDYLFLAFNTSTTLSPTDTSALARWAKILMML